jgi:hypothetical protein
MTTSYSAPDYFRNSPYFKTEIKNNLYLDVLTMRPIPARADDILYKIEVQYTHRPDLLAYDLYADRNLWWVFSQRNLNVIRDPVYDMEAGVEIYLPQMKYLKGEL